MERRPPVLAAQLSLIPDIGAGGDSPFSRGLTGAELAARLGVNPSTVSRNWEKWDGVKFSQWSRLSREDFQALYPQESHNPKSRKIPDHDGLGWEKRGDRFYPEVRQFFD
ncbi:MAG: helix-turn-helix domain-containing protein [Snowella sp.]